MENHATLVKYKQSLPAKWFSSPFVKTSHSRWYRTVQGALFYLFSACGTPAITLKDKALIRDIKLCKEIISRIENSEHSKSPLQKYKGFPQKDIHLLSGVLQKCPLGISIDFGWYATTKGRDMSAVEKEVVELQKQKSAPKLRFYPLSFGVEFPNEMKDEGCRHLLTLGLFDYLQRLILREPGRVRKCRGCGEWFMMTRADNFTCSKTCKDSVWAKKPESRQLRRTSQQKYRDNNKKKRSRL